MAELVDRRLCVRKVANLSPGRVKPMASKIDTCCFLAWRLALIGLGKNGLAQCRDNVSGRSGHRSCCLFFQYGNTITPARPLNKAKYYS